MINKPYTAYQNLAFTCISINTLRCQNKLVFPLLKTTCPPSDWRRQQKGTQKNECVVEIIPHMSYQERKQLLRNLLFHLLLFSLCKFDNSLINQVALVAAQIAHNVFLNLCSRVSLFKGSSSTFQACLVWPMLTSFIIMSAMQQLHHDNRDFFSKTFRFP